jgi:6-phosphogluconolactonase
MMNIRRYASFNDLMHDAANEWTKVIQQERDLPCIGFALAGGSTPAPLYRYFAECWARGELADAPLRFVPTDERWVPTDDPQSNERMIRECFVPLIDEEHPHRFVSLKTDAPTAGAALGELSLRIENAFPGPFSAVLLGMGADAHIASIFPGNAGVDPLNPSSPCMVAIHPESGQPRISLSMNRLLDTRRIWLVIKGEEKRQLLQRIEADRNLDLPVAELIRRASCAVDVFWCP